MPELPLVSPGEIIASGHINDIMLRTAQRYSSIAVRTAENPTPAAGELAMMDAEGSQPFRLAMFTGIGWVAVGDLIFVEVDGDVMTGDLEMGDGTQSTAIQLRVNRSISGTKETLRLTTSTAELTPGYGAVVHAKADVTDATLFLGGGEARVQGTTSAGRLVIERQGVAFQWRYAIGSNGDLLLQSSPDGITWTTVVDTDPAQIKAEAAGTAALPPYTFVDQPDTGMWLNGTSISLARLGANVMTIGTFFASQPIYDSQAGTANVSVASNGRLTRITSALKYKDDVVTADLADVALRPVEYRSKEHGTRHLGLVADEVAQEMPDAAVVGADGDIEDYDTRAVIAVLVAKINRLEARLADA